MNICLPRESEMLILLSLKVLTAKMITTNSEENSLSNKSSQKNYTIFYILFLIMGQILIRLPLWSIKT